MIKKRIKQMLVFLLAFALSISNISFIYADDGAGEGTGQEPAPAEISGGSTITENGIYTITEGTTGTIKIDATEVTLIGGGEAHTFSGLYIVCNKEKTSLTFQDVWISGSNTKPAIDFTGVDNYLYVKGVNLIKDSNKSGGFSLIHVDSDTELTIDNAKDTVETGTLYFNSGTFSPAIGGNRDEAHGNITIAGGRILGLVSKNGPAIGVTVKTTGKCGDIRITGGEVNLLGADSLNPSMIGGSSQGGKVYISGGLVSLAIEKDDVAIGGENYDVIITGGSIKTCKGWQDTTYDSSEEIITAKKVNGNGESVYPLVVDTSQEEGDTYHISIDGISYYEGGNYQYGSILEGATNVYVDKSGTLPNWKTITDNNLYLYVAKGNHKVTVNGTDYLYSFNETTQAFENKGLIAEKIKTGTTGHGNISVSSSEPNPGDTVTVTAAPDEGNYLAQVRYSYADSEGKTVYKVIKPDGSGAYSFIMPGEKAEVTADFIPVVWDGTIDVTWYDPSATAYNIQYAAQLAGVAAINNGIFNNYPCEETASGENAPSIEENGIPKGSVDSLYNVYGTGENQTAVVGDIKYITAQSGTAAGEEGGSSSTYWYGSEDYRGKTINLTADLDMGGICDGDKYDGGIWSGTNYMPIGGQYLMDTANTGTHLRSTFNGTFNGQGHLVNNIYCNRKADSGNNYDGRSVGLIGHMGIYDEADTLSPYADPDVKNVAVDGYIAGGSCVGGIIGNSMSDRSVVESCLNFARVAGGQDGAGGIIGSARNRLTIKSCANFGSITGWGLDEQTSNTAGICGNSNKTQTFDSYNFGDVMPGVALGVYGLGGPVFIETINYEYPIWTNCYWYMETCWYGTRYSEASAGATRLTKSSYFNASSFLSKINGTDEKSLLYFYNLNKSTVKISGTGRDWVATSGAQFVSDTIRNALAGIKIHVYNSDTQTYDLTAADCSQFAVPRAFTQDASAFTGTISTTGEVNLKNKPGETGYVSGQEFDMGTFKIWAEYSDGTKEAITDYNVTPETGGEKLTVNDTKVTISGTYKGTPYSYVYNISVVQNKVSYLKITEAPVNLLYASGESFDKTGMVITATYLNGEVSEISDYTCSPSRTLKDGDTDIIISYTYNGVVSTALQPVTVLDTAAPVIDSEGRFKLSSVNDMLWFANQVNTGLNQSINGILMNDIDLSGATWTPIGKLFGANDSKNKWYCGILDGNGKTVNLNLTSTENYNGFCGGLGSEGIIKNLTIEGTVSGFNHIGGIVGILNDGTITGCTNNADINAYQDVTPYPDTKSSGHYAGGIAGEVSAGEISDCVNNGEIKADNKFAGGITGNSKDVGLIIRCTNKGDISAANYAAGISAGSATISYCGNEGTVKVASPVGRAFFETYNYAYGIGGKNVSSCYNTGIISLDMTRYASVGSYGRVYGIGGTLVVNCYNTGELTGKADNVYVYGISQYNPTGEIKNCYNSGKLTAELTSEEGTSYVGSILINNNQSASNSNILNNYALIGTADKIIDGNDSNFTDANAAFVTSDELKALTQTLGEAYREGHISINKGYPLLKWQALGTVELVDKAISELGTITLDSRTALETVRAAYEALTDEEKQYVTKLSILEEAESTYQALKAAVDKEVAAGVDVLIGNIGIVTLDSKEVIETARNAYNELDADQKAYVTKLSILETAETTYAQLVAAKEKLEADKAAAAKTDTLISNIGTVTLDSKDTIKAARESYDALSADQKALVAKLSILTAAEERFEKLTQDKAAADKVAAKIEALPVSITLSDIKVVEAAREAYDALTTDQKVLVGNSSRLVDVEVEIVLQKEVMEAAIEQIYNGQGNKVEISMDNLPLLTRDLLEAMKESGKEVTFVKEEGGKVLYSWTFDGSKLNDANIEIPLGISFTSAHSSAIDILAGDDNSLYIHFAYHGTLPAPAVIRVYAGDKYKDGDTVNLYYYNDDTGKAEEITKGLVVKDGYVTFAITHCSDYFLTKADLSKQEGIVDGPQLTGQTGMVTGDDTPFIPVMVLMGISLAGIAVLTRRKVCK